MNNLRISWKIYVINIEYVYEDWNRVSPLALKIKKSLYIHQLWKNSISTQFRTLKINFHHIIVHIGIILSLFPITFFYGHIINRISLYGCNDDSIRQQHRRQRRRRNQRSIHSNMDDTQTGHFLLANKIFPFAHYML